MASPKLKNWQTYALFGLLAIHIVWVFWHISLVATERVNPWKMGGYAMYTQPSRGVSVVVNELNPDGTIKVIDWPNADGFRSYDLDRFYRDNWYFNLYCKPVTKRSLDKLFEDNEILRGKDILIELYAERFRAKPIRMNTEKIAEIKVLWHDNTFDYDARNCRAMPIENLVQGGV